MTELQRRIYGLETEFGITCVARGGRGLSADEAARALLRPIIEATKASNIFLPNGSRLYLDVGSHPEYATAECDDLVDLVVHDRAGEAIMADLAERANRQLAADGVPGEIVMFKNNTDSHGNSYGTHENYLVRRVDDFKAVTAALLPFLVTRQLLCGAGKLVATPGGGARYLVSQRAEHMLDAVSSATTRSRPMINTRDEPHANPHEYRRMHVIVGDANLSDVSNLIKVGSMELVLRTVEERGAGAFADLALADPLAAIRDTAHRLDGGAAVRLEDGRTLRAIEVQREVLARIAEPADATLAEVHARWARILDALAAGDLGRIEREVDWVIKLRWLQRYAEKHGMALDDPRLAQVDLAYHAITGRGVFRLLEARGAVERVTTDAEVAAARDEPPATTRARLRGRFVRAAQAARRPVSVDWMTMGVPDLADSTVICPDPFAAEDPRVDALIERLAREPRQGTGFHFADAPPL